jgi:hypothetical protein
MTAGLSYACADSSLELNPVDIDWALDILIGDIDGHVKRNESEQNLKMDFAKRREIHKINQKAPAKISEF